MEVWDTPDGDFLEIHRLSAPVGAPVSTPHVLLLHGLEGTVRSHYAQGLLAEMRRRGWSADLLIWRSCGSRPNLARRFYHSGETGDLSFTLRHIALELPSVPLGVVGVSLGGNILLKFLGENGAAARSIVAAAAISVPFDLGRGCDSITHGFARVYQRHFLTSLKRKAIEKQSRYPDLPTADQISRIATLREFDNIITAPIHGFRDATDYYARSSSIRYLKDISVDTLLLSAMDDPFSPEDVLDDVARIATPNEHLTIDFPRRGGHAGFVGGRNPFRPVYYLEHRVGDFLAKNFAMAAARTG
jgi:predicted alpha/beta-fold hydrolase